MIGIFNRFKWTLGDKLVLPPQSTNVLGEYLKSDFLVIQKSKHNFMQINQDENIYHVEWWDKKHSKCNEFHSIGDLWGEVIKYAEDNYSTASHNQNNMLSSAGVCKMAALIIASLAFFQLIFFLVTELCVIGNLIFNILGTLVLLGVSYGLQSGKFFIQHADASYDQSVVNFWGSAVVGAVFGIVIISFSYM